jgi:hypothetical protein
MIAVDVVIGTTWVASTSYIPILDGYPDIETIPTTQYVSGVGAICPVYVRNSQEHGVQLTSAVVKYNVLKLHYNEVEALKRYVGLSERP